MFRLIVIGLPCLSGFRLILFVLTFQFWLPSAVCCLSSGWFCLSIDYPACFSLSPHLFCSTSRNICLGFFRFLLSSVSALLVVSFILFIVIRLTHASFFIRFIPLFAFKGCLFVIIFILFVTRFILFFIRLSGILRSVDIRGLPFLSTGLCCLCCKSCASRLILFKLYWYLVNVSHPVHPFCHQVVMFSVRSVLFLVSCIYTVCQQVFPVCHQAFFIRHCIICLLSG